MHGKIMSNVDLANLFIESRYPSGWKLITLLLYTPIGIVLTVLRIFILLQAFIAASLLPQLSKVRSFVLRSICCVLGIVVRQENEKYRDRSVRVLISNHISPFDHLATHLITGCFTLSIWEMPRPVAKALGLHPVGVAQRGRAALVPEVSRLLSYYLGPALLHPEADTTSGRNGMLKFSTWPFCIEKSVQPLTVSYSRPPLTDVAISTLGSTTLADVLWLFFCPCTFFTLRYLPVMTQSLDETEEVFASRVEAAIASDLELPTTNHTAGDKADHLKRRILEQQQSSSTATTTTRHLTTPIAASASPELQRMVGQVAEVLPYVPRDVILKDLAKTRSVDITISNILEGHVVYEPLTEPSTITSRPSGSSLPSEIRTSLPTNFSIGASSTLDTSAPAFAKSARDRMLSFQERKARLIENARLKYAEKHGIKIAGYNC